MRKSFLAVILAASLAMSGCSAKSYKIAEGAYTGIRIACNLAITDLPNLVTAGIVPANDQSVVSAFLAAACGPDGTGGLNGAYNSCIDNAQNAMLNTGGKFADCLGVFSVALSDPKLLAGLRVVNPKTQQRVQLWILAIVTPVNIAVSLLGKPVAPPPVVSTAAVSAEELREFQLRSLQDASLSARQVRELRTAGGL